MRAGQNPAKFVERVDNPERITIAIVTYIPFLSGYYAQALEVLKTCLLSLWQNTNQTYDLLVFDNASGPETVEYLRALHREGRIQYLLLSERNLGKGRAWDFIFNAAPGEIIAYADSDVFFYPNWLSRAMTILESFPRVGMVTCRPMRTLPELYSATETWASSEPTALLERGQWMTWETFREHDVSLGQDEESVNRRYKGTEDLRITYKGKSALVGAAHWQFVAYKSVLQQFTPLGIERPLGDDRKLDTSVNQAEYLRLMTSEPLVRHLGNTLPADISKAIDADLQAPVKDKPRWRKRLLEWPPVRRVLLFIHNTIFRWYFNA